jgi:hypothetical protein
LTRSLHANRCPPASSAGRLRISAAQALLENALDGRKAFLSQANGFLGLGRIAAIFTPRDAQSHNALQQLNILPLAKTERTRQSRAIKSFHCLVIAT